jgi:hypothetical protein
VKNPEELIPVQNEVRHFNPSRARHVLPSSGLDMPLKGLFSCRVQFAVILDDKYDRYPVEMRANIVNVCPYGDRVSGVSAGRGERVS